MSAHPVVAVLLKHFPTSDEMLINAAAHALLAGTRSSMTGVYDADEVERTLLGVQDLRGRLKALPPKIRDRLRAGMGCRVTDLTNG